MAEILSALTFCVLLGASTWGGFFLRTRLPDEHLSERNMEALRLIISLLVTFAALVLSLQLSSVKSGFDAAYHDRSADAAQLVQLDLCLRNYGDGTEAARANLRSYTAAVIASTWPEEPRPSGVDYPDPTQMPRAGESAALSQLLNRLGLEINGLTPADPLHQNLAAECRANYAQMQQRRWAVIEDARGADSTLFSNIVTFWLMLVFLGFGLQAPRRPLSVVVLAIGVISISSVMFVIADMEAPYDGVFGIPSTAMREALAAMNR